MKKIIIILALFSIVLVAGCGSTDEPTSTTTEEYQPKIGSYFDEEGNLLGKCGAHSSESSYGDEFYDLEGNYIGKCSWRSGPGSSGDHGFCTNEVIGKRACNGGIIVKDWDNAREECGGEFWTSSRYECVYDG